MPHATPTTSLSTRSLHLALGSMALAAMTLSTPALAQQASSLQAYGVLDIAYGSFKDAGGQRSTQVSPGNMSTSFFGFKGSEDLGNGVKTIFALESYVRNDTGAVGRYDGDTFWSRNAYVGLQSDAAGTVKLGRSGTPLFFNTMRYNPFGAAFGVSPAIRSFFSYTGKVAGDTAWDNAIAYNSPTLAGFTADVLYSAKELGHGPNSSLGLRYAQGALSVGLAAQQVETAFTQGDEKTWQLGGSYDFGVLRLMGQYGEVKEGATNKATANTKDKITQLGSAVPFGQGEFQASWAQARTSGKLNTTRTFVTLGYDYKLSKRTDVYGVAMSDRWTNKDSGSTFAVGLRHAF